MPSLAEFARRIRARGRQVEEGASRVVRQTAVAVSQAVISSTPVDTGRARANWVASLGAPFATPTEDTDPSGAGRISVNNTTISARRPGQDVYISNNLPYIGRLNEGHSAQAPAGFVEKAVQTGVNAVRAARVLRS